MQIQTGDILHLYANYSNYIWKYNFLVFLFYNFQNTLAKKQCIHLFFNDTLKSVSQVPLANVQATGIVGMKEEFLYTLNKIYEIFN